MSINDIDMVAPLAGAWIEILYTEHMFESRGVAPLAGAWIEISPATNPLDRDPRSLPLRERGLKFVRRADGTSYLGRSPCGSVD